MQLEGKRAVVTGGGRGIGAEVARTLAAAGASVVVCSRTLSEVEAVASELTEAGHSAFALTCDVAEPAEITTLAAAANEMLGGVDILVNNAGFAPSAPLRSVTLEEWERVFAVNMTGTFLCTQAFLPAMIDAGWGRVINIASIAGKVGHPYIAAYAASKHAVLGFTRAVAMEAAAHGVTVNAICPGYVDTPLIDASVERIVAKTGISAAEAVGHMKKMSPQGRLIDVEEVAYLTLCLCDPLARGINGQGLVIDGGAVQS
jgi:3-hydroxybutyrate dehydrogenase